MSVQCAPRRESNVVLQSFLHIEAINDVYLVEQCTNNAGRHRKRGSGVKKPILHLAHPSQPSKNFESDNDGSFANKENWPFSTFFFHNMFIIWCNFKHSKTITGSHAKKKEKKSLSRTKFFVFHDDGSFAGDINR